MLILVSAALLLVSCSSLDKTVHQQAARNKLSDELSKIEIYGNPVDLTMLVLDEAQNQMRADEALRSFSKVSEFALNKAPGYRVVVGEKLYPKFQERFLGDGFMWRDRIIDMSVSRQVPGIRVEAPIRFFRLEERGGDRYAAFVEERDGNSGNDLVRAKARIVYALAPEEYRKAVERVKKIYPDFEW